MQLHFVTVDVFSSRPFGGNPLAVVLNAEGVTTEQMQNIAMEFNLAETTFVLPPEDPTHTARVRIFTPRLELPFAGHPNVGTAYALASRSASPVDGPLTFEEKAGLVELDLLKDGDVVSGARLEAPRPLALGDEIAVEMVADACSVDVGDIDVSHHLPVVASTGVPFVLARLKTRRALATARPRADVFEERLPSDEAVGILLYVPVDENGVDIHARVFAPLAGVPEDPATGSANVALIGFLAKLHPDRDVELTKSIAQGVDLGRPSSMRAEAAKRDGELAGTWIGGTCVSMLEGTLDLD